MRSLELDTSMTNGNNPIRGAIRALSALLLEPYSPMSPHQPGHFHFAPSRKRAKTQIRAIGFMLLEPL